MVNLFFAHGVLAGWLGIAALILGCGAWLLKDRERVLILAGIGSFFWAGHFLLIGAASAGAVNIVVSLRTVLASRVKSAHARHALFFSFFVIFILISYFTWQGPISLAPVLAAIWATFCYAYLPNIQMRIAVLLSSLLWLGQSIYWESWQNMLSEILKIGVTFIGLARLKAHEVKLLRENVE